MGSPPSLNRCRTVFLHTPLTGSNPLSEQTSSVKVPSPLGMELTTVGVAAVGEGLGEGEGVGAGFDDFGAWAPDLSRCLTIVFISPFGAALFSAFLGSTFLANLFSSLPRESPIALAPVFSLRLRSSTLRGLVATCADGGGLGFGVTGGSVALVELAVLNTIGLRAGVDT